LDEDSERYPLELDIAFQAWRAAINSARTDLTPEQKLSDWLKKCYPDISTEAKKRISGCVIGTREEEGLPVSE